MNERITRQVAEKLVDWGFKQVNEYLLVRNEQGAIDQVRYATRRDRSSGREFVTIHIGIRFPALEALLNPSNEDTEAPTISVPLFVLHEGERRFMEWEVDHPETVSILVSEITRYALPFFHKYTDIDKVRASLESNRPRDWFNFTPLTRAESLAAIYFAQGRKPEAIALLDEEIAKQPRFPVGRRLTLKRFRDRLSQLGDQQDKP